MGAQTSSGGALTFARAMVMSLAEGVIANFDLAHEANTKAAQTKSREGFKTISAAPFDWAVAWRGATLARQAIQRLPWRDWLQKRAAYFDSHR